MSMPSYIQDQHLSRRRELNTYLRIRFRVHESLPGFTVAWNWRKWANSLLRKKQISETQQWPVGAK